MTRVGRLPELQDPLGTVRARAAEGRVFPDQVGDDPGMLQRRCGSERFALDAGKIRGDLADDCTWDGANQEHGTLVRWREAAPDCCGAPLSRTRRIENAHP